ncbi:hypothetical protein [Sphingomonas sp. M1-B02]|uniref:hypothetical protein n=1 Tax=Sphingomonas sp. M1-B02 TaxID=3114300 RepID=UPI00223F36D0|nr:hypothetical protein [Sphingomonas sp. S6-11]UZK65279.1 hypothetical protein OKW87_12235 [Sphingomonas sp. S6-11]
MTFLRFFSPIHAARDLRFFLSQRKPHELGFVMLSLTLTGIILWMFVKDSHFERPYKREIIYVESWPLDRSLEQIRAQQAIDEPIRQARIAELEKKRKARQAEFKKVDDWLTARGI